MDTEQQPDGDSSDESCNPIGVRERFPELITEFRRVAKSLLAKFPAPSIASGDLITLAFLKLLGEEARRIIRKHSDLGSKTDAELKCCFGTACRDVLSTRWHRRNRRKVVEGRAASAQESNDELSIVDAEDLLVELEIRMPLAAQIVEAKTFGGMSNAECAAVFGCSERTVVRENAKGKNWLRTQLEDGR